MSLTEAKFTVIKSDSRTKVAFSIFKSVKQAKELFTAFGLYYSLSGQAIAEPA